MRTLMLLAVLVAWMCLAVRESAGDSPSSEQHSLSIRVVEAATGSPVENASVSMQFGKAKFTGTTDAAGLVSFDYSGTEPLMTVDVAVRGFAPRKIQWVDHSRARTAKIPEVHTFHLERGVDIGGRVVNELGQPVADATVELRLWKELDNGESISIEDNSIRTDSDGRWSRADMPSQLDALTLEAFHPDYARDPHAWPRRVSDQAALRSQSWSITLQSGVRVTGRVFDATGIPVSDATVVPMSDRFLSGSRDTALMRTDSEGRFSYTAVRGQPLSLKVTAPGHAPDTIDVQPNDDIDSLDLHLKPPRRLSVRVLDSHDRPVEGASVMVHGWRGSRDLMARGATDAEGRFTWADAPSDTVMLNLGKRGFTGIHDLPVVARKEEHVVVLRPILRVEATVVDAQTGEYVERFEVLKGVQFPDQSGVSWLDFEGPLAGSMGRLAIELDDPYPAYVLRVKADGYAPVDSRAFTPDEENISLSFKLSPEVQRDVQILQPDGRPAVGAFVHPLDAPERAVVVNGVLSDPYADAKQPPTTDADGRVSLTPQATGARWMILHDTGMAHLRDADIGQTVHLSAWAIVDGVAFIGSKPAADVEVSAWFAQDNAARDSVLWIENAGRCDAEGRFRLDRVPAGHAIVGRLLRNGNTISVTHGVSLDLAPGDRETVRLGGTGRPVIGRVQLPDALARTGQWRMALGSIETDEPLPDFPIPEHVRTMAPEQFHQWQAAWLESPEGMDYSRRFNEVQARAKRFPLFLQRDGSFRVEDVPPGHYALKIALAEQLQPGSFSGEPVASGRLSFTVPEVPGGQSDEPLDLPPLKLTGNITALKVGDLAPDFEAVDLKGNSLRLSDFAGKFVLLDFWATWCKPCLEETPFMQRAWDQHGADSRLVMLGLSLDAKPEHASAYVEREQLAWRQGFLGPWSSSDVPERYGVTGVPTIMLIGPDGRVLATQLRRERISAAIAMALRSAP